VVAIGLLVAACGSPVATPPPSAVTEPTAAPTDEPGLGALCPTLELDPSSSLGPEFDEESFVHGESDGIGAAFVDGLGRLYAGDAAANPCDWFTGPGLESAAATDDRLGQAIAGISRLDAELRFRHASEGTYDLRERPPMVPLDVFFDIPDGSTTTDVASGATDTTLTPERASLRVTFGYEGTRWLADHVERVPPQDAAVFALPTPRTSLKPCKGFRDDPEGTPFDNDAGLSVDRERQRPWCADGGDGPKLDDDLVSLSTRFPCGEDRIAILTIGWPLGTPSDPLDRHEYVRDPSGLARERGWLHERWRRVGQPPEEAEDTGWTNGNMDVWIDEAEVEQAVYVRTGGRFERWPRGDDPSVTDCN
jgi:hypothetical protein